jgi:hypothetical protein
MPKLSIIFGEILSCAHGNFEQQNGVLRVASSLLLLYFFLLSAYFPKMEIGL